MTDPLVRITNIRSVVGFDPHTLLPSRQVQFTYMVGDQGPFTHVTPEDKFTDEYVKQVTDKTVSVLRNTGAIKP